MTPADLCISVGELGFTDIQKREDIASPPTVTDDDLKPALLHIQLLIGEAIIMAAKVKDTELYDLLEVKVDATDIE